MNKNKISPKVVLIAGLILSASVALPAFAETSGAVTGSTSPRAQLRINAKADAQATLITRIKARAGEEITRRITALNELNTKVGAMKKVSDADKATLAGQIQTQVVTLTTLKTKIDADTDIAVLRTDVKSITASYRIFMLIIPRGHIIAAADRMSTIADEMTALGAKIQARITAAQTAGKDVTALNALLADFTAKLADAKTQSQAAIAKVVPLNPDNGDTAVMQANNAALKAARADIKAGTQDFKNAREDVEKIRKGLKEFHLPTSTSTTSVTP